jgi:acyl-CoA thioesterase-1
MKSILIIITSLFLASCGQLSESAVTTQTEKTIIAIWDSLTAWYGLPISDSYPSQLEEELQKQWYKYRLVNAGISGDTTAWVLSRLDWILEDTTPSLIILCIGANDAFQWKDTSEIEKNLRQIIEKIQIKSIPILFAGMRAPLNLGGEYWKTYEELFPKLAKEYNLAYMKFFLEAVALKAQLNQADRIHPTKEWYAIIVGNLIEIMKSENLITQ